MLDKIETRKLEFNDEIPYDLLLLADETLEAINKYISKSEIYVYEYQNKAIGVFVFEVLNSKNAEIKNIAVTKSFQGKGIGSKLLENAIAIASEKGIENLSIGTPSVSLKQIKLYERMGFIKSKKIKDFYIKNYVAPIFESGVQLIDMQVLTKKINV